MTYPKTQQIRAERREIAEMRQTDYDALSLEAKIVRAVQRGHVLSKEHSKLQRKLEIQNVPQSVETSTGEQVVLAKKLTPEQKAVKKQEHDARAKLAQK